MKIYTHVYKDKEYDFTLTNKAKCAIEELQYELLGDFEDPELLKMMMDISKLQDDLKQAEEAEDKEQVAIIKNKMVELNIKSIPLNKKIMKMQDSTIDTEEIAFILLNCNKKYRDVMTRDLWDEIKEDMEEVLEFEKYNDVLLDIADKVFTVIEKVKDKETGVFKKQKTKSKTPSKMN